MVTHKKYSNFKEFETSLIAYLISDNEFLKSHLTIFKYCLRKIDSYLTLHHITNYTVSLNKDIRCHYYKDQPIRNLKDYDQNFLRYLMKISEYLTTGKITFYRHSVDRNYVFGGEIGAAIQKFLEYKSKIINERSRLLDAYRPILKDFHQYCIDEKIQVISNINIETILNFISNVDHKSLNKMLITIRALKILFKYLFDYKFLNSDLSLKIPKYKHVTQPNLPSTYSVEEVNILLGSIFQNSKIGKRNYAILLLATKLGLRASDISNLKFENLNWEKSTIEFNSIKTGKHLVLPLLPDVGESIINYLKNGRPTSQLPYVFLTGRFPIRAFPSSNVVTHIVQRSFKNAGVDITQRKFGPHALRHSLADRLLKTKANLPQIGAILGHKDSQSTMFYLRIDVESLSMCMLEIPPIDKLFYTAIY